MNVFVKPDEQRRTCLSLAIERKGTMKSNVIQRITLCAILLLMFTSVVCAQESNDFGIWTSAAVEKKLDKKWSTEAEAGLRSRNDSRTIDRWSFGVAVNYKLQQWLTASAGYVLLYDNNVEKISCHDDGTYNRWRPSYWGVRHRFNVSVTGKFSFGDLQISLRERWQYTCRPEQEADRFDFDIMEWEKKTVDGKCRSILRSRLQAEYDIPKCKVDPYVSVELFNGMTLQKVRYSVGADWKILKKHVVGVGYRYQTVNEDDDNESGCHVLDISYKYKF